MRRTTPATAIHRAVRQAAGLGRYLLARVLVHAADVLPRSALVCVIGVIVRVEVCMTRRGKSALAEGHEVLGLSQADARRVAIRWLSIPMTDLVDLRRMCRGRERPAETWSFDHRGRELVEPSLTAGTPMLVATGHFSYATTMAAALAMPALAEGATVAPIEPFRLDGDVLHRRLLLGMVHQLSARERRVSLDYIGDQDVTANLRRTLRTPGGFGLAFIDVAWDRKGAVVRPFCAERARPLSAGPARIARLAGIPLILAVPERTGPRSCRIHWGPRIEPPARSDRAADRSVLDRLVDALEGHIGQRRSQYPYPLGWERHWDAVARSWVDPAACAQRDSDAPVFGEVADAGATLLRT